MDQAFYKDRSNKQERGLGQGGSLRSSLEDVNMAKPKAKHLGTGGAAKAGKKIADHRASQKSKLDEIFGKMTHVQKKK